MESKQLVQASKTHKVWTGLYATEVLALLEGKMLFHFASYDPNQFFSEEGFWVIPNDSRNHRREIFREEIQPFFDRKDEICHEDSRKISLYIKSKVIHTIELDPETAQVKSDDLEFLKKIQPSMSQKLRYVVEYMVTRKYSCKILALRAHKSANPIWKKGYTDRQVPVYNLDKVPAGEKTAVIDDEHFNNAISAFIDADQGSIVPPNFFTVNIKGFSRSEDGILLFDGVEVKNHQEIEVDSVASGAASAWTRQAKEGDMFFVYCKRGAGCQSSTGGPLPVSLKTRGIYAVGKSISKPYRSRRGRKAIRISIIALLRDIVPQLEVISNPITYWATPYQGNRNDAIQRHPDETNEKLSPHPEQGIEFVRMILNRNPELRETITQEWPYFKRMFEIDRTPELNSSKIFDFFKPFTPTETNHLIENDNSTTQRR